MSTDVQPCKILGDSKETKVSFEWNFWEDILKISFWDTFKLALSRTNQTEDICSQSWCTDFPLSHQVNIMIRQIFLPFAAVYSQLNQRNDIFTCGENVLSNHEEPVRSTGFSMRETPYLFTKFIMRKDQTQCWPPGPFPILVSTI